MRDIWLRRRHAAWGAVSTATILMLSAAPAVASPPPSPTASPSVNAAQAGDKPDKLPTIHAWSWVVADADTGQVLAGRAWDHPLPPASTLKTLTALTLEPRLDPESVYTAEYADEHAEGSHAGVVAGSTYKVSDLFHGMLMPSGNDAAVSLAHAYGGMERTVDAMNAEAARIGLKNTHIVNDSGLDEPGQVSSAYDLATIFRNSLANPNLQSYYLLHHVQFPAPYKAGKKRTSFPIWTENRLVLNHYEGALGGKTGFTSQAGRTYVGAAQRDGRRLVIAIMRCAESTERTAKRLLEWGFANADRVQPVDQLPDVVPLNPTPVREAAWNRPAPVSAAVPVVASQSSSSTLLLVSVFVVAVIGLAVFLRRRWVIAQQRQRDMERQRRRARNIDLRERERSRY